MIISRSNKKYLICVVGPTAIGKTSLGIELAQHFKTEIISADSRQFYKEMSIGTAVPSKDELQLVKHHFIHHKSIQEKYNVGAFEKDALSKIDTLHNSHDVLIMVGGSGMYVDAVVNGLDEFPEVDPSIRHSLNQRLENNGLDDLRNELSTIDPMTYKSIDLDNPHRIIRALEVSLGSGHPYSSFLKKNNVRRPFETIFIGLDAEREIIYNRINERVDEMMKARLLAEVEELRPYQHLNALNTVGYKELFQFLNKKWTLEFAVSEIKKNTRRFAKRQLTWFKKNENILWFDHQTPVDTIIETILLEIKKSA